MKRFIIALIIMIGVVAGGTYLYRQMQPTASSGAVTAVPDANTQAINTGVSTVSAEGQLVPIRHAILSFATTGEVVEIITPEDSLVQPGDPILRLDSADQEIAMQQAQAALAQAQAGLAAAEAEREAAAAGVAAADVNIRAAEAALALAQAPPTAAQIAVSEAAVALAQAQISAAAGSQTLALEGPTTGERLLAEAQVLAAQAAQKPVQDALGAATRLEAPQDTIDQITTQYNAAIANLAAAEGALAELDAGATAAERTAAANAVSAAQSQRDAAQAQLGLLLAGARPEQIAIAETAVARALAAKTEADIGWQQADTAVLQAQAAVSQAEALVAAAAEALAQRTLTAPFAGTIARLEAESGEVVTAGAPVVTLADFSQWLVETTDLAEQDVVAIAPGFHTAVSVDALPNQSLVGTVSDIARFASLTQGEVTYRVRIALPDTTGLPLRWGMTAFVDIATSDAAPVISVSQNPAPGSEFVVAEGVVVPRRRSDLAFQSGGRLAEFIATEGQRVQAGDPLLRLDSSSQEIVLRQMQAEVTIAEAALAAAQTRLTAVQAAVQTAQTAVAEAEARLALLLAGPRPEDVAAAQFDVAAAAASIAQATANRDAILQIPQSQILTAQANVAASQAALKATQDEYDAILSSCTQITLPDGSTQTVCPLYGTVEETKRAELEQAKVQVEAAQAVLDALLAGPTAGQRAAAGGGVSIAQANRNLAEARLALIQADPTPEQIQQAEVGVELAQTAVSRAETAVSQAQAGIAQAEAALLQAQANVQAAELALARTTLYAPFAGIVANIQPALGELVAPGMPVLSLADLSAWQVETTDLTELDVVNIQPGDAAELRVDAIPNTTLRGVITDIDSIATPARGDVTYVVTIELGDAANLPLRWGMTAVVDVTP
ncbi:MAG TPA: HlyD family efflux transporter periplasmic adaptor subunit [Chloroflexota bacterium]|nr:HlyD family efflux transporter periplasmic adaptor subunit [Chloroflexota bacterium]